MTLNPEWTERGKESCGCLRKRVMTFDLIRSELTVNAYCWYNWCGSRLAVYRSALYIPLSLSLRVRFRGTANEAIPRSILLTVQGTIEFLNKNTNYEKGNYKKPGYRYKMVKHRRRLLKKGYRFDRQTRRWFKGDSSSPQRGRRQSPELVEGLG